MIGAEFEAAAERYADNIYAIAFNYFKNPYDADDIVQDVLLKLYQTDMIFESSEHLKYWLLRVTVNRCKTISFSGRNRKNISFEEYADALGNCEIDGGQDEAVRRYEILKEIMKLPKKYRTIIHLFYYEDYDTKTIAGMLSMNEATVRTRLARGRKILKEVLSDV